MILTTSPMANTAIPNPKKYQIKIFHKSANKDIFKKLHSRTANQELVDTP